MGIYRCLILLNLNFINSILSNLTDNTGREFMAVECILYTMYKEQCMIHNETARTNREIVSNHLTYTCMYMFLVADTYVWKNQEKITKTVRRIML